MQAPAGSKQGAVEHSSADGRRSAGTAARRRSRVDRTPVGLVVPQVQAHRRGALLQGCNTPACAACRAATVPPVRRRPPVQSRQPPRGQPQQCRSASRKLVSMTTRDHVFRRPSRCTHRSERVAPQLAVGARAGGVARRTAVRRRRLPVCDEAGCLLPGTPEHVLAPFGAQGNSR